MVCRSILISMYRSRATQLVSTVCATDISCFRSVRLPVYPVLPCVMNKASDECMPYDDTCEHATTEVVCRNYVVVLSCGSYPAPAYLCDRTCCRYWSCSVDGGYESKASATLYESKASATLYAEVLLECDRYVRISSIGHVILTRRNDDIVI